jgi:hypothetical protein
MCCGRGAGDRVPLNTHSITIGLLIVLYLNVYVRDLSETWALTLTPLEGGHHENIFNQVWIKKCLGKD